MNSNTKLVSSFYIIQKTLEEIGEESMKDAPILSEWIKDAERKIESRVSLEERNEILDIDGCTIDLPCETAYVRGLILGDHSDVCGDIFDRLDGYCGGSAQYTIDYTNPHTGVGITVISSDRSGVVLPSSLGFHVRDNKIILDFAPDEDKATVKLYTYPTDRDGHLMIPDEHSVAIGWYIKYMLVWRSRWRRRGSRMPASDIQMIERIWKQNCNSARANDALQNHEAINEAKQIVNNPLSGHAMEFNTHNQNYY